MKKYIDEIVFRLSLQAQYSNTHGFLAVIVSAATIVSFLWYYDGNTPENFTTVIYWSICPIIGITFMNLVDLFFKGVSVPHSFQRQHIPSSVFDHDMDAGLWITAGVMQVVAVFILFLQYEPVLASILLTISIGGIPILLFLLLAEKIEMLGECYEPLSKKDYT